MSRCGVSSIEHATTAVVSLLNEPSSASTTGVPSSTGPGRAHVCQAPPDGHGWSRASTTDTAARGGRSVRASSAAGWRAARRRTGTAPVRTAPGSPASSNGRSRPGDLRSSAAENSRQTNAVLGALGGVGAHEPQHRLPEAGAGYADRQRQRRGALALRQTDDLVHRREPVTGRNRRRYRLAEEETDEQIAERDVGSDALIALPAETAIRGRAEESLTVAEIDGSLRSCGSPPAGWRGTPTRGESACESGSSGFRVRARRSGVGIGFGS